MYVRRRKSDGCTEFLFFQGCTKAFISAGDLKVHKAYHGERNFICDLCGKALSTKYLLQIHLRTKHKALPELELKCKHCDEVFANYTHRGDNT